VEWIGVSREKIPGTLAICAHLFYRILEVPDTEIETVIPGLGTLTGDVGWLSQVSTKRAKGTAPHTLHQVKLINLKHNTIIF
jgi:hypothetical protein